MFRNRRAIDARDSLPDHYDLRFLNTAVQASDFDLQTLAESIKESGRRDFSLLCLGPPGTGKTQYLSYLANMLEMDVMLKDAASLTSKYVSETEKLITAAFAEAEERQMFLVINEGDTFVRRRDDLGQNHEVSAVNTMLTCMERHTQPFGFTTNLGKNIDPAAKRRFLFKVAFEYLKPEQIVMAFEHFFNRTCSLADMQKGPRLVPADFVNVRKQINFVRGEITEERLLRLLALEAKEREDAYGRQLYNGKDEGFGFMPR
jgi:SpoVK/Ycf46/Vps4 family AAA+-type ATPase